jgi:hypothetical protein
VKVGGAVAGLRTTVARKGRFAGQKMAMFRIQGLEACSIQAVCFPEDFKNLADRMADDAIGLFTGVLDNSREEPSLRVQQLELVEDLLARRVTSVILTLVAPEESLLSSLRELVREMPGSTPLYLKFTGRNGRAELIRCGANYKIAVTEESLDRLGALVGHDHVHCR